MRLGIFLYLQLAIVIASMLMGSNALYNSYMTTYNSNMYRYVTGNETLQTNLSYEDCLLMEQSTPNSQCIPEAMSIGTLGSVLKSFLFTDGGVAVLISGVAIFFLSLALGFASVYLIPFILVYFALNLFVFPISIITESALPLIGKIIAVLVYNLLLIITVIEFISGRQ